jgi:hypothetical protein
MRKLGLTLVLVLLFVSLSSVFVRADDGEIDPKVAWADISITKGGLIIDKIKLASQQYSNLLASEAGAELQVALLNSKGEVVVRLDLRLDEEQKFSGRVLENKSRGQVECAITREVVVCSTTPFPLSMKRSPLYVLWPRNEKLYSWRMPE